MLWYILNEIIFRTGLFPFYRFKVFLLRLFGAQIGKGVKIKPHVNIKYPWELIIGNHVWIGENVWIDNLAQVRINDHVCISQGALLLTGNHDYSKVGFDLMTEGIELDTGCWVGAKAIVCPGVKVGSHAVLTVQSVASSDLEPYMIYTGNPAKPVKNRTIQ